jgi:hypothetical protein
MEITNMDNYVAKLIGIIPQVLEGVYRCINIQR